MPEHKTIHSYLDTVAEQIRWQRAKSVVTAELERHLEDQRDAFAEEGYTNPEEMAVEEMGDPVTVGTELDRIHRPKPQWGLIVITILFALAGVILRIWLTSDFSYSSVDPFKTVLSFGIGCCALIAGYLVDYTFGAKHIRGIYIAAMILSVYFLIFSPRPMGIPFHVRYVVLFFPVLYAFWLYHCCRNGWKGLLLATSGGIPLVMICCIAHYVFGGVLILLSGFVLIIVAAWNDSFGVGRWKGMSLPVACATVILSIAAYGITCLEWGANRIQATLHPELDPLDGGYQAISIRKALNASQWIGKGTWDTELFLAPYERIVPGCDSDAFLTTVIYKLGWMPFLILVAVFAALMLWLLLRCTKQKSQLGRLVVIAVMMTLFIQAACSLSWTMGFTILSSFFPFLTGNVNMVLNMTLIGLALSVFRGDSIARNSRCEEKTTPKYRIRFVIEKI